MEKCYGGILVDRDADKKVCVDKIEADKEIEIYNTDEDISELYSRLSSDNLQEVEEISRRIKELAVNEGINTIKNLAFRIQLAARRRDLNEVIKLIEELGIDIDK